MPISRKLLDADEPVVLSTRTHGKALLGPSVVLIVLAGAAGFVGTLTAAAGRAQPLLLAVVWGIAGLLALRWVVRPFLEWLATTYTLTDRRLIVRRGVLRRHGHDIPLSRVGDVSYQRGLLDRALGCGTLQVAVAGDRRVELDDIPHVERVHRRIQDLLLEGAATDVFHQEMPRAHDRR